MADLSPFPDVHAVLALVLADLAATVDGPRLPANFQKVMPIIRVIRIGGSSDQITDRPRIGVDVYAATYPDSWNIAEAVRQRLISGPHITSEGCLDRAVVEVGPHEIPWPDDLVRYHTATYTCALRRRTT